MRVFILTTFLALLSLGVETNKLNLGFGDALSSINGFDEPVLDGGILRPSAQLIFGSSKQLLAGLPFEIVFEAINQVCSAAVSSKVIKSKITPDVHRMQFQLRTSCNKYSYPLLEADDMWRSPEFDPKKKVVILATGWTTTVNDTDTIDVMAKAYNCRGDTNFVAVDADRFVDTLYTWSALNTEDIGEHVADGLIRLTEIVPVENIHLIGHSLGAHIVGAAGRFFTIKTGKTLPRITGLDPANPCFNEGEQLSGLYRGDAKFVDIIHTNPGVLGQRDPVGDVDYYPDGLSPLAPGCLTIIASHARAWEYYAETVYPGNEENFMATRCSSLLRLRSGKCPGEEFPMGYSTPNHLKGNYFLEANRRAPYGENGDLKRLWAHKECGLCRSNRIF